MDKINEGYTRVSTILSQWDTFGHIEKVILENKAAIGTRVHEAINNHHEGIYTPLDHAASPYFESYVLWEKQVKPTILHSEQRYYCDKLKITGQVDSIITIPGDNRLVLVDYKTSAQESPKIWPLQATFYHYLATSNGMELSDRLIFIKLDKKGALPKIYEYTYSKAVWDICLSAWKCYRYLNP